MSKSLGSDWLGGSWHVPEDDLLPFLDGELLVKEAKKIRTHLEACWSCRRRIEKLQTTISAFVEYCNKAYVVGLDPAPGGWRTFDTKLMSVMATADRQRVLHSWILSTIESLLGMRSMLRLTLAVSAGALLIVAPIVFLYRTPRVSASELIGRASEARNLWISAVAHPVVYQKVRVQAGSHSVDSLTWEIWNDEESGATNQRVEDSAGLRTISPKWDNAASHAGQARRYRIRRTRGSQTSRGSADRGVPAVLRKLHQVFQANRMDWRRPLVAASYASWTSSLRHVSEEVRETRLPSGEQTYVLMAAAGGPFEIDDITKTELTIRSRDWHPLEQRLEFQEGNHIESLDLTELAFSVSSAETPISSIIVDKSPLTPHVVGPPAAPTEVELLEGETQARYALHQVRACTGEPVEVRREPSGRVVVQGVVEALQRKVELEERLRLIPLVTVSIESPGDPGSPGVAARGTSLESEPAKPPPPPAPEAIQKVSSARSPIEDQLREYFTHRSTLDPEHARLGSDTGGIDQEITALSNEAVSLSESALMEAWALRRLAEAYSQVKTDQLSPRSRQLLEIMVTDHLAALKQQTSRSRALLEPLMSSLGSHTLPPAGEHEEQATRSFDASDSTWSMALLRLWATTQHMEKLTGYLFTGANWPEAKNDSAQDLMNDWNEIDFESRQTEAKLAARFSGHADLTGDRESDTARVPR